MSVSSNILVTGFRPFAGYTVNASWETVKVLSESMKGLTIQELTVDYLAAHQEVSALLSAAPADILLLSGVSTYASLVVEKCARKPSSLEMVAGPEYLEGCWPWQENIDILNVAGTPTESSDNAGNFVCESVYWSALNFRRLYGYPRFLAFFHVPHLSKYWTPFRLANAFQLSVELVKRKVESTPHEGIGLV